MKKYQVTWISPSGNLEKRICENIFVLNQLCFSVVRSLIDFEFSISSFTVKTI